MQKVFAAVAACFLLAGPVLAEQRLNFEALPQEGGTLRFDKGVPTMDVQRPHGAIQVTPLGLDHGRLTFGVSVLNLGEAPDNFGVEDIHASAAGQDLPVLTRERLDHMARTRAMWAQIAVAVVAGASAGLAASQRDTYSATTFTPHGTYQTIFTAPSTAGQIAAAGSVAAGGYAIGEIQSQLDATRAALGDEIIQTTTVDPRTGYAGRIVVEKLHGHNTGWPQDVTLHMTLNGEDYPFVFRVTRGH